MELSYTPLWKSVFTKCTDVNSDGIWCCGGVKYPSTCYRKISTWSHIQDYETRINNVCCIRGRISSCLWWTVYLRFAYSDMYEQENQSMTLENTVSEEKVENGTENVQEISEKRRKSMAVVTLLSISPLITSLLGFAIAYVSDDEIRRKVECLELEKIEIDEKISEIDAAIAQMEHYMEEGIERELTFDEQAMNAAEDEIIARGNVMKAQARFILAEFLSNPQATTKLSEEMLLKDKEPSVE